MRTIPILSYMTFASRSKSFNSITFSFLHLDIWVCFDTRDSFACMNFIRLNRMPIKIFYNFDWISFSFYLNFIWLHSLLNQCSQISKSDINACLSNTCIGGIFNSLKQFIICRIKCYSKCSINNTSVDMRSKIYFAHIIISNNSIISWIGSVMSCNVI